MSTSKMMQPLLAHWCRLNTFQFVPKRLFSRSIEVERKFLCTPNTVSLLNANRGLPPFSSIQQLGHRAFTDIYYDHNNLLCSHGIWVRQRDGTWQAKIHQGGDYINSQFEEVSGWDACRDVVANVYQSHTHDSKDTFGLEPIARIRTERHEWEINNRFQVVADTTDFGHSVGEVELIHDVETEMDDEDVVAVRDGVLARLNEEIEDFMRTCVGISRGKGYWEVVRIF